MEPKFQTSFIPKKPVDSSPKSYLYKQPSNIFSVIATLIFVVTLLIAGGLFGYRVMLNNEITAADNEITAARADFQEKTIKEIIRYNNQMEAANQILNNHIVIYPLLAQLEEQTLRNVSFETLKYLREGDKVKIEGNVIAKSYNALAQQSEKFNSNKFLIEPTLSNFKLTEEGLISGDFNSYVDSSLFSYRRIVESSNAN